MRTTRLEAFSDGVLAIIITIMVLELHAPEEPTLDALSESTVGFLTYLLSFVFIGIYWSNHHHLFHLVKHVSGAVLWANLHLLFWLSLIPFTTAWMAETTFAQVPVAVYGANHLVAAIAYSILQRAIYGTDGGDQIALAFGRDWKGKASVLLYMVGILSAAISPYLALAIYVGVVLMWLIPDRRVERFLTSQPAVAE